MSNIVNKVKEALHSDKKSAPEGATGPHNSRAANAADPRVDSDRDGSRNAGLRQAGHGEYASTGVGSNTYGGSTTGNTYGGSSTTGNTFGSSGMSEGATGPHNSRLANAADPRIDSDRDGSRTMGGNTGGGFGSTGRTAGGLGSTGTTTGIGGSNANPFSGAGSGHTGMTGTHGAPAGTHGPHGSRMANAADPRIDSDRDGRGAIGTGPGPASNTAGPHSSDMANKIDPRVDSDLDGSKTLGGNKTYQSGTNTNTSGWAGQRKDPTDAAQVPPSVLKKTLGEPVMEHHDVQHQRERRNSIKTHQETFSGI